MLNTVSAGDYKNVRIYHEAFISFHIQPRTENLLNNRRNFNIISQSADTTTLIILSVYLKDSMGYLQSNIKRLSMEIINPERYH